LETARKISFWLLVGVCTLGLPGCGKKADENKPISEIKAEAEQMSVEKLRAQAAVYRDAIVAKKAEVEKIVSKLGDIPLTKLLGDETKGLKADVEKLNKSVSALTERFQVYYEKLKEKGGDLSGLEI
jgi:ATP-dependent Clp protease ATP-binding subunit ClpA